MKEKTLRLVMIKYFESKDIKVETSKGAGPDLLIDGQAVEVKGSKFDFDKMLRQLLDYSKKYSNVALALPYDGLPTLRKIHQLDSLIGMIKEARNINVEIYCVAPDEKAQAFYVRESTLPLEWWTNSSPLVMTLGFNYKTPRETIDKAVDNLIKYYSPIEEFRKRIPSDYPFTHKITKIELNI